jgi:hypothetical protein
MSPIVVVESPFAGDVVRNLRYARAALRDSLLRGECPVGSHLLYTQPGVLDDGIPADREHGMRAGFEFKRVAEYTVVYTDLGISPGMEAGIVRSTGMGYTVKYRSLGSGWEEAAIEHENSFKTRWP